MARFNRGRDVRMFHFVNKELIQQVMDTYVVLYKLILEETKPNIYGESESKTYYDGTKVHCIVDYPEPNYGVDERMQNYQQTIQVKFNRKFMDTVNLVAEMDDVVEWNNNYYKITNIYQNQLLGGQQTPEHNWSIICEATLTNRDELGFVDSNDTGEF